MATRGWTQLHGQLCGHRRASTGGLTGVCTLRLTHKGTAVRASVCVRVCTCGHEYACAQPGWSHVPHACGRAGHTAGTKAPGLGHLPHRTGGGAGWERSLVILSRHVRLAQVVCWESPPQAQSLLVLSSPLGLGPRCWSSRRGLGRSRRAEGVWPVARKKEGPALGVSQECLGQGSGGRRHPSSPGGWAELPLVGLAAEVTGALALSRGPEAAEAEQLCSSKLCLRLPQGGLHKA